MGTDAIDQMDKNEIDSWPRLQSIVCEEAHREECSTGKCRAEKRYYLTSHKPDADMLQKFIRQHWSIENRRHWVLDVIRKRDASRIRKANAAHNIALLRKLALN